MSNEIKEAEFNKITLDIAEQWGAKPHQVFALAESFISSKEVVPPQKIHEFLMVASEHRLNPALREIGAFYSSGKGLTCFTMIDGWMTLANRHPQMDGYEFEYEYKDEALISCTCILYRKDRSHPTRTRVKLSEWRESGQWTKKSEWMLTVKSLKHAVRFTFGYAGLHDDYEAREIQGIPREAVIDVPSTLELAEEEKQTATEILDAMQSAEPPPANEYEIAAESVKEHSKQKSLDLEPIDESQKPGLTDEEKAAILENERRMMQEE